MTTNLKYKGYTGTAEFCTKDNIHHGKIAEINDLVTYEAESLQKLREEFEEAVDDLMHTRSHIEKF